jgi:hypothetical protein
VKHFKINQIKLDYLMLGMPDLQRYAGVSSFETKIAVPSQKMDIKIEIFKYLSRLFTIKLL